MTTRRNLLLAMILLPLTLGNATSWAAPDEATALVKRTAERMLSTLQARRAEVDRNPSLIYGMIDDILAPHFDFDKITQGAVGKNWNKADTTQRRQLVDGFKQVLVRTYARSLLSYSGEEIRYLPPKPDTKGNKVTVSTEVRAPGASPVPVDYRMYNSATGWKVFDVVINNASLVGNYRSSFDAQIRRGGIDGLIAELADKNRKGQE